ncbi:MAG: hypothetical protein J7J98_09350 [candidate division Zixibacteria bacterium]|nr:hypothetical protein [candidate division Zixibacteria bacterium]
MSNLLKFLLVGLTLCLLPAVSSGEVWEYSAPDSTAGTLSFISMELDSVGNPHLAYFNGSDYSANYATRANGVWTQSVVDSLGFTGFNPAITLDDLDNPHIAYSGDGYNIEYAELTDSGWYHYIIDSSGFNNSNVTTGYECSIDINGDGRVCVTYIKQVSGDDTLMYAVQNDIFWTHYAVAPIYDCDYMCLTMDGAGTPVIGFQTEGSSDPYPDSLIVARGFNAGAGTWELIPLPDTISETGSANISFDLTASDQPCFFTIIPGDTIWSLNTYNGSSWTKELVGRPDDILYMGWPGGMSFDNNGDPWVMAGQYLSHRTGGVWSHVSTDLYGTPYILRFDSDNNVQVLTSYLSYMYHVRYWPGDPQLVLPEPSHNWNGNYDDWECPIQNAGTAPLILDRYRYAQGTPVDTVFPVTNPYWPWSIYPGITDSLTVRFTPPDTGTYYDTLQVNSNDSTQLWVDIPLQGSSTASADQGDLSVHVNNSYADMEYCNLVEIAPLTGARVGLYQGGVLQYGLATTGGSGSASIAGVDIGTYQLRVFSTFNRSGVPYLDTVGVTRSITIETGFNNAEFVVPDSLVKQAHAWANTLDTLVEDISWLDSVSGETPIVYSYQSAADIRDLVLANQGNVSEGFRQSLARLVLAEKLVEEIFASGEYMAGHVINGISELINFLFYSDTWFDSLLEILEFLWHLFVDKCAALMDIVMMFAKTILVALLDVAVDQIASTLPCTDNGVICGKDIVMVAWQTVKEQYSSWGSMLSGFSSSSWERMRYMIKDVVEFALIQGVFIDMQTNDDLEQAVEYADDGGYNGSYSSACNNVVGAITGERAYVEGMGEHCDNLIFAAQMFQMTGSIMGYASLIPGYAMLGDVGQALEIVSYGEVAAAIGISGTILFQIPGMLEDGVDDTFYPDGVPGIGRSGRGNYARALASPQLTAEILAQLQVSTGVYDSTLGLIQDSISAGSIEGAALTMESLMSAETQMQSDLRMACAPIYSASRLAGDTASAYHVEGFDTVYHDFMTDSESAGKGRLMNLLAVSFLPVLESEPEKEDSLSAFLTSSISKNQTLVTQVETVLDTVAGVPLPAIVVVSHAEQGNYSLDGMTDQDTISIRVRNVGALSAENVQIVMTSNAALDMGQPDTVTIGTLIVGEESDEYNWYVSTGALNYTRGTWTAEIVSTNAETFSYSGSYQTPAALTPGTGGSLDDDSVYCYPNPFNPDDGVSTNLRYSLETASDVTIKIYDAGGNLVRTLLDGQAQDAVTEQSVPWDGRNGDGSIVANGVYFFVIESSADERAVGKTAVLR